MSLPAASARAGRGAGAQVGSRSRRRTRVTPGAAILAMAVVALLVALTVPLRIYLGERAQLARLDRQAQVLQQQNRDLQSQVRMLHDPAYLEQLARGCLGMVRPGEIQFAVAERGSWTPLAASNSAPPSLTSSSGC